MDEDTITVSFLHGIPISSLGFPCYFISNKCAPGGERIMLLGELIWGGGLWRLCTQEAKQIKIVAFGAGYWGSFGLETI